MRFAEDDQRATAARVAAHAEIRDIKATRLRAELTQEAEPGRALAYEESPDVSFELSEDRELLVVDLAWGLVVRQHDDDVEIEQQETIAEVLVSLTSLYSLLPFADDESQEPFSDDELTAFAESSGKFALYPFVREAIHDLTGRLSLPPLTLPMLKSGLTPIDREQSQLEQ